MWCLAHSIHHVSASISHYQGDKVFNHISETDFKVGDSEVHDFLAESRVVNYDLDKVRSLISFFRKVAVYLKRHPKSQNRLKALRQLKATRSSRLAPPT